MSISLLYMGNEDRKFSKHGTSLPGNNNSEGNMWRTTNG